MAKGVDCIDGDVQIVVVADLDEMLAESAPDTLPLEPNSVHIERCNLDELLKTELLWIIWVAQLLFGNLAKILDEVDNGILVQILTLKENGLNLV